MKWKQHIAAVLPLFLVILCFSFGFAQVMLVMYGQTTQASGRKYSEPVRVVYPEELSYPADGIDPNTADIETLCLLPGVGEVTAQAFHDELMKNGPFYYPEDILSVKGIAEKKLEKIRPLIRLH